MKLTIFDSEGTPLKVGDILKLQEKRNGTLTFYSTVQIIDGQLYPFNKFCFDRAIKVDSIPEDCKKTEAKEDLPEFWMHPKTELYLIEQGKMERWRMDNLMFENNKFFRVEP